MFPLNKEKFLEINSLLFQRIKPVPHITGDLITLPYPDVEKICQSKPQVTQEEQKENLTRVKKSIDVIQTIQSKVFTKETQETEKLPPQKKYLIHTLPTSIISLPPNYSTDDYDEKFLVDLINGKDDYDWEKEKKEKNMTTKVAERKSDSTFIVKSEMKIEYPLETIFKALTKFEVQKECNKKLKKFELLSTKEEENLMTDELYLYLPFPFFLGDRDMVQKKKCWTSYSGDPKKALIHFKTVQHQDFPAQKKPIRVEIFCAGYYLESIGENLTKMVYVNHSDFKFSPSLKGIIKGKCFDQAKRVFEQICEGCKIVIKKKL